jgi:uncharacterized membrane protein HdeD (DUF308 family)
VNVVGNTTIIKVDTVLMNRIVVYFFLIAIGLILFVICLSAWDTKEGELFGGILLLYSGVVILIKSIPKRENNMYGLRFRGILTGIVGIIGGIVIIFSYLT